MVRSNIDIRCKGCYHEDAICWIKNEVGLIKRCQCAICIVKPMCDDMCNPRLDLYNRARVHG